MGPRVVWVADSLSYSQPSQEQQGGEGTRRSKITPQSQAAAPSGHTPLTRNRARAAACISGYRAELFELKNQILSFLGYLTVCLARRGDYW